VSKSKVRNSRIKNMFGTDVVFCVACRSSFQERRVAYERELTIYEDPDMQSDDDLFFTDTRRRKVIVESQQDDTDDLFDALLQEEKATDKPEDEEGSVHNDRDNSHK
jgi:hypothetical protein